LDLLLEKLGVDHWTPFGGIVEPEDEEGQRNIFIGNITETHACDCI